MDAEIRDVWATLAQLGGVMNYVDMQSIARTKASAEASAKYGTPAADAPWPERERWLRLFNRVYYREIDRLMAEAAPTA